MNPRPYQTKAVQDAPSLLKNLTYSKKDGIFYSKYTGKQIGFKDHGYTRIAIGKKKYYAHRLAWLHEYGYMPKMIDHINQDKSDNRIENLREVNDLINSKNRPLNPRNKSGINGVCFNGVMNKHECYIWDNYKKINLGYYADINEAKMVRENANAQYGYSEIHGVQNGS